jgi:hypothetical protein
MQGGGRFKVMWNSLQLVDAAFSSIWCGQDARAPGGEFLFTVQSHITLNRSRAGVVGCAHG